MADRRVAGLCTFHRDGQWCARPEADETIHVWPDERMRHGAHVWRHDLRDEPRLIAELDRRAQEEPADSESRSPDYLRGYQAGYHAAARLHDR